MFETLKRQIKNGRLARDIDIDEENLNTPITCNDTEYEAQCPECDHEFDVNIDIYDLNLEYNTSNSEYLILAIYECFGIKDGETPEEFRTRIINEFLANKS